MEKLYLWGCPIIGSEIFDLERNLGWHNLKSLILGTKELNR